MPIGFHYNKPISHNAFASVGNLKGGKCMGALNVVTNQYWEDNVRFADMTNLVVFGGMQFLKAEDLLPETQSSGTTQKNRKKRKALERARDIIRKATIGSNYVMIGIENQSEINYTMPVRIMGYNFLGYDRQIKELQKIHRQKNDLKPGAEFLSGISASDRLKPTFTYVLYYGTEPWSGPNSLFELIDWSDIPNDLRKCIADYPIKVVDLRHLEDSEKLHSDARLLIGFLKRSENVNDLKNYVKDNEREFSALPDDTIELISVLTKSENLLTSKDDYMNEEGAIDMCKALEDLKEEGRQEGLEHGQKTFITNLLKKGISDTEICALVECDQSLIDAVRATL